MVNLIYCNLLCLPLITYEINLDLTWSKDCGIFCATRKAKFETTDRKLYVLDITLLAQDNVKLLKQLESGFERKITWNKYQSKVTIERQNQCLDYLIHPSFMEYIDFCFTI